MDGTATNQGAQGADGPQGTAGSKGSRGRAGTAGTSPPGDQGTQGHQGIQGPLGLVRSSGFRFTWVDTGNGTNQTDQPTSSGTFVRHPRTSGQPALVYWFDKIIFNDTDADGLDFGAFVDFMFPSGKDDLYYMVAKTDAGTGSEPMHVWKLMSGQNQIIRNASGYIEVAANNTAVVYTNDALTNGQNLYFEFVPAGRKGADGYSTSPGDQGTQGHQGLQGLQGNQGFAAQLGNQGEQGPQGIRGNQGYSGNSGPQGATGTVLNQGYQGYQGITGNNGPDVYISTSSPDLSITTDGAIWFKI